MIRRTLPLLAALTTLAACGGEDAPLPEEGAGLVFVAAPDTEAPALGGAGPERPSFVDFGAVPGGEVVEHTFYLRNDDPGPIVVERMTSSCGCTVPRLLYRGAGGEVVAGQKVAGEPVIEVPPGAVLEVTLRVDTEAVRTKNRDKFTFVRMTTSSPRSAFVELEAHLLVEQLFQVVPETLDLQRVPQSGTGVGTVEVARAYPSGATLGELLSVPDDLIATVEPELRGSTPVWTVRVEIQPPHRVGPYRSEVRIQGLAEDGTPSGVVKVPVVANVVPDVEVLPARLHTGTLDEDGRGSGEVELRCNLPGHRVRILDAAVEGEWKDHLTLEWSPRSKDAQGRSEAWTIRLAAEPGIEGRLFQGEVVLELDDPTLSPMVIPYAGLTAGPVQ